jgi:type IV pilus assembly protein PilV
MAWDICRSNTCYKAQRQYGFSLFEILVAILILSFGLMGLAQLQSATVRFKTNSWVRSAAATLFTDMADRLRANPTQTGSAYGAGTSTVSAYLFSQTWSTQQSATLSITKDCVATTCTSSERATYDLETWRINTRRMIPQGSVNIEGNRATGFTLTLSWFDKNNGDTPPAICTASLTGMAAANCCPSALSVATTNGVRCLRMTLIP